MAKVGVVMPCFNHGKYIDEAVQSILDQTFQDIEIVIIDDGSNDGFTREKLQKSCFPKTKIFFQDNQGPCVARNNAISFTTAEYILPLDADDHFDSTYIEKAVNVLNSNPGMGAVTCFIQLFGDANHIVKTTGGNSCDFVSRNNACVSSLFRRICWEEVGGYNIVMKDGYEDWDFWLSITEKGWSVGVIEEVLFYYRRINTESRDLNADKLKPRLIKQIVENHIDIYRENLVSYVINKEEEIIKLKEANQVIIDQIYDSKQYKIGNKLLLPLIAFKKIVFG